jgi:hypothetical protein
VYVIFLYISYAFIVTFFVSVTAMASLDIRFHMSYNFISQLCYPVYVIFLYISYAFIVTFLFLSLLWLLLIYVFMCLTISSHNYAIRQFYHPPNNTTALRCQWYVTIRLHLALRRRTWRLQCPEQACSSDTKSFVLSKGHENCSMDYWKN